MVKVALDIGHGSDTFPPSKGIYKDGKAYAEHDFNSKLVMAIDPLLRASGIDTMIYQKPHTRDINLNQRTNHYNAQKVDLVYSIHANYNGNSAVNGRCVFYWHTSKQSKKLADLVVKEIKNAGYSTHGNGLHASMPGSWTNLHICRMTNMPAVLVENGFMSGDKDFDLVFGAKQAQYIKDMSEVHAKAICAYFGVKYKESDSATEDTPKNDKPTATKPKKDKPYTVDATWPKLENYGPNVGKWQRKLKTLGYYKGEIDNSFGPATHKATIAYQKAKGLAQDGQAGPLTQAAADKDIAAKNKKQTVHLPKTASSWRVYPTNKAPTKGNEKGYLNPKKFGGISYEILAKPQADVVTIQTRDFGKVNIYVGKGTGAVIK